VFFKGWNQNSVVNRAGNRLEEIALRCPRSFLFVDIGCRPSGIAKYAKTTRAEDL